MSKPANDTRPATPRKQDVTRWVAILATATPDHRAVNGSAMQRTIRERERARGCLQAWGLDGYGLPLA